MAVIVAGYPVAIATAITDIPWLLGIYRSKTTPSPSGLEWLSMISPCNHGNNYYINVLMVIRTLLLCHTQGMKHYHTEGVR